MDTLPNDILQELISACGLSLAFRFSLTCKRLNCGETWRLLREIDFDIGQFEPRYALNVLKALAKRHQNMVSLQSVAWSSPPLPGVINEKEIRKYEVEIMSNICKTARFVKIHQKQRYADGAIESALRAYDPAKIERLELACTVLSTAHLKLKPHHCLTSLNLSILADVTELKALVSWNLSRECPALRELSLGFVFLRDMLHNQARSTELLEALQTIAHHNPKLRTFSIRPSESGETIVASPEYLLGFVSLLMGKSANGKPSPLHTPVELVDSLKLPITSIKIDDKSLFEIFYTQNFDFASDFGLETCDTLFRQCFPDLRHTAATECFLMFHNLLCSKKPTFYDEYLEWIESMFFDPISAENAPADQVTLRYALLMLGNRIGFFNSRTSTAARAAIERGVEACKILFKAVRHPSSYLLLSPDSLGAEYKGNLVDPLFAGALRCVKWCSGSGAEARVTLKPKKLAKFRASIKLFPHRIGQVIDDVNYNPRAIITENLTLGQWLLDAALDVPPREISGVDVQWAMVAIESCAAAGVVAPQAIVDSIRPQMLSVLLQNRSVVIAMARIFGKIGHFLNEEYLDATTVGSQIENFKLLFEIHAKNWPDDPPLEKTLNTMSDNMWKHILATADDESVSRGELRSVAHTLIHSFPRIPRFMVDWMQGKKNLATASSANSARMSLYTLLHEEVRVEQHDSCTTM